MVRSLPSGSDPSYPSAISAKIGLSADGLLLEYSIPLLFRWTDPVDGEAYRPFEIRPRVTIQVEDKVSIFAGEGPQKIKIRLKSHSPNVAGRVRLRGPDIWRISPAGIPFALAGKYEEREVTFEVAPPKLADEADLTAEAEIDGEKMNRAMVEISYPHIRRQVYFPDSRLKVVKLDIKTEGKRLGYVMGAGDEVPDALRNLGYEVIPLTDQMLEKTDLSVIRRGHYGRQGLQYAGSPQDHARTASPICRTRRNPCCSIQRGLWSADQLHRPLSVDHRTRPGQCGKRARCLFGSGSSAFKFSQ